MQKEILYDLLMESFTKESCKKDLQNSWNEENPTFGQDDVASLLVNDFFGGKILVCNVSGMEHYFNLIGGKLIDTTINQFKGVVPNFAGFEIDRNLLDGEVLDRYNVLLTNFRANINKEMSKKKSNL